MSHIAYSLVCIQKYGWTGANSYFTKADEDGLCFGAGRLAVSYYFCFPSTVSRYVNDVNLPTVS